MPVAGAYERVHRPADHAAVRAQPTGHDEDEPSGSTGGRHGADLPPAARHDSERPGYADEGRERRAPHLDRDRERRDPHDAARDRSGGHGTERGAAGAHGSARVPESGARPVGVVHHTETVHVTTRHTIVDGGGDPAGPRYGGFAGRWSPPVEERPRGAEAAEYRGAGRHEPGRDEHARSGWSGADEDGWSGSPRSGLGAERAWPDPRDEAEGLRPGAPGDGSSWGGDGREHPWAGVGRAAGGEQGWASREVDDGWSSHSGGEAGERRSWPGSGTERVAGTRSRPAGPGHHDGPANRRDAPARLVPGTWTVQPDADLRPEERPAPSWRRPAEQYGRTEQPGEADQYGRADQYGGIEQPGGADQYGRADQHGRAEQYGRATPVGQHGRAAVPVEPDGDQWSELRTGSRWAAVRDDGRGRELRIGERRAAVHADDGGTEYRVEDRWASVRGPARQDPSPGEGWPEERQAALPAGGVPVPDEWRPPAQRSGQPEWRQAEPERRQPRPEWRQPQSEWRQPQPEWRQPQSERRGPEPGDRDRPPRDAGNRWP